MEVMRPPTTILPLLLVGELYNYHAKKEPRLIWTSFSIQDKKYNSDNLGTFILSSLAKTAQASMC